MLIPFQNFLSNKQATRLIARAKNCLIVVHLKNPCEPNGIHSVIGTSGTRKQGNLESIELIRKAFDYNIADALTNKCIKATSLTLLDKPGCREKDLFRSLPCNTERWKRPYWRNDRRRARMSTLTQKKYSSLDLVNLPEQRQTNLGIEAFKITQVYFVALSDGTYSM